MNDTTIDIAANLETFLRPLDGTGCRLVAVSKTKPNELIMQAYAHGQRIFGENKVQDLAAKYEDLPKDIEWHMIGHLQRNKVKYIAPFVSMIHAVDSLKLLQEINKRAAQHDRQINCLLQIHIAREETKFGLDEAEVLALVSSEEASQMANIRLCGLMGMATNTGDMEQVRQEFRGLRTLFERVKAEVPPRDNLHFRELSIGMSGDWQVALEEGSTMIRIGSAIFGARG